MRLFLLEDDDAIGMGLEMVELTALEYRCFWIFVNDNTLTVYIKRLRDKIEKILQILRSLKRSGDLVVREHEEK